MKTYSKCLVFLAITPMVIVGGCASTGETVIDDSSEKFNFLGAVDDPTALSKKVRDALRKAPQTAVSRIKVSKLSEDSVKLSGTVENDAIKYEAERVAGNVDGVRFVVNSLFVQ